MVYSIDSIPPGLYDIDYTILTVLQFEFFRPIYFNLINIGMMGPAMKRMVKLGKFHFF